MPNALADSLVAILGAKAPLAEGQRNQLAGQVTGYPDMLRALLALALAEARRRGLDWKGGVGLAPAAGPTASLREAAQAWAATLPDGAGSFSEMQVLDKLVSEELPGALGVETVDRLLVAAARLVGLELSDEGLAPVEPTPSAAEREAWLYGEPVPRPRRLSPEEARLALAANPLQVVGLLGASPSPALLGAWAACLVDELAQHGLGPDAREGWTSRAAGGARDTAVAIVGRAMGTGDLSQPLVRDLGQRLTPERSLELFVRMVYDVLGGSVVDAGGRLQLEGTD